MNFCFKKSFMFILMFGWSLAAFASTGPYLFGQVGFYGSRSNDNLIDNLFDSGSIRKPAARFGIGYAWEACRGLRLGLEGGANFFDSINYQETGLITVKSRFQRFSFDVMGVLDYYFTRRFDVFFKAGGAYSRQEYSLVAPNIVAFDKTKERLVPKVGGGFGFDATDKVNVNISLTHEFSREEYSGFLRSPFLSATAILIGVRYALS